MPYTHLRLNTSARFAVPFCLDTICNRVIWIFFTTALLLVWQVKAQIQANQVVDFARQLQSQNVGFRRYAVETLAKVGPAAKDVVSALTKTAFNRSDGTVRRSVAEALKKIEAETIGTEEGCRVRK